MTLEHSKNTHAGKTLRGNALAALTLTGQELNIRVTTPAMGSSRRQGAGDIRMFLTFALMAQLAVGSMSYSEARAQVGEHESHLSIEHGDRLYEAQEKAMNEAVPKCMDSVRPRESLKVSLVLSIGSDGKAVESWSKEDSAFAKCMAEALASKIYISPPVQPFFTSFELNLGIKPGTP